MKMQVVRDVTIKFAIVNYWYLFVGWMLWKTSAEDLCRGAPDLGQKHDQKCVWMIHGANLSESERGCDDYAGNIFTFQSIEEGAYILTVLGVDTSTPVFVGAMRNHLNHTTYYDWLSRPGTWSTDIQSAISNENSTSLDDDCLVLQNERLQKESCSARMATTICEREITKECTCTNASDTSVYPVFVMIPVNHSTSTDSHTLPDRYFNSVHTTRSLTTQSPTTTTTQLQTDKENNTDTYCDTMDVLNISFSALIDKILGQGSSSNSGGTECQNKTIVTDTTVEPVAEKTTIPVTEVKFQFVSGLLNGPVMTGSKYNPPLRIDQHSTDYGILVNISRELMEFQSTKHVDNDTLLSFADSVSNWTVDDRLVTETKDVQRDLFEDILQVAEDLVGNISTSIDDVRVSSGTIDIVSKILKPSVNGTHTSFDLNQETRDADVQLSNSIFNNDSVKVRVSTVTYSGMDTIAQGIDKRISSNVISVTVKIISGDVVKRQSIKTEDAIIFAMRTFLNKGKHEQGRLCTYWSFSKSQWSTKGCSVIAKNSSFTTCKCNHLTNFAILVMYMDTNSVSIQNEHVLFTLTTVGCSLSIACLAMTLITYVYLRMLDNEKIMIHANLSLALMLAQIVFVSSSDAHGHETACKVVALLLHFLFMASFSWMMVEGIALYLTCTRGIQANINKEMKVKYFLIGWGVPAIIVIVSCAAHFPSYGDGPQYSCWLSTQNGLIWAFLGPMLLIVLLNVGVMGLVVKVFLTLRRNTEKSEMARLRGSLRAMVTLLPLLGLGWILSLLVPFSVVFNYFFVIVNTLQGMCIFFLHCICNDEIRKLFREKRRRWSTTRTASDFDVAFHTRRKTGSFDGIKAATSTMTNENSRRHVWRENGNGGVKVSNQSCTGVE